MDDWSQATSWWDVIHGALLFAILFTLWIRGDRR